ncbi:hypothetical protein SeMB42_g05785 [Synchytrium endobioticum]|uniref:Uncharacterized protein n=1 Tax=Synchytrium endobioticum TaxID=286115 RepID=A0A507CUT0_9FUNG|nr:hypothetical protein SeMB42_g05785 [Synchytrium endobioticum]TPX42848.1 hypothetical protein SeLEV6574_g05377 [Synchytrium endobioticum]
MGVDGAKAGKAATREVNVVGNDAIWRTLIRFELASAKNWERSWGFMRETLRPDQTNSSTLRLPPITHQRAKSPQASASGLPSKLPCGLATDAEPVLADLMTLSTDGSGTGI